MGLEATMIIVDNSESSRNGDYTPTRWQAQADAVHLIFQAKTGSNPESSVGLMSMGGKGPEVLSTLTTDEGKILQGLHATSVRGSSHLTTGIQVAGLALKHRQNGMQRQRIIAFVCSPIEEDEKSLVKLARKMKKGAVSIDFIAFGDMDPDTLKKLEAFNEAVKGGEGSHLAIIPPGDNLLSDSILETEILSGDGMGPATRGAGAGDGDAGDDFAFGIDPSADPELAMALRMSLEDEKARVEKEKREQEAKEGKASLEGIAEENGTSESQPLLNKDGEASGSSDKKDKDDDKMDTA